MKKRLLIIFFIAVIPLFNVFYQISLNNHETDPASYQDIKQQANFHTTVLAI